MWKKVFPSPPLYMLHAQRKKTRLSLFFNKTFKCKTFFYKKKYKKQNKTKNNYLYALVQQVLIMLPVHPESWVSSNNKRVLLYRNSFLLFPPLLRLEFVYISSLFQNYLSDKFWNDYYFSLILSFTIPLHLCLPNQPYCK